MKDDLIDYVSSQNDSFYSIILDSNVIGREEYESDFKLDTGTNGELMLKKALLGDREFYLSKFANYLYEITENTEPLYYGGCSFEAFTSQYSMYLFTIQDAFILIASSSEGDNIYFFDNIIACQNKCHHYLLDTIDYLEIEIKNYQELKDDGKDTTHFFLNIDWYFDLSHYLHDLGLLADEDYARIERINKFVDTH